MLDQHGEPVPGSIEFYDKRVDYYDKKEPKMLEQVCASCKFWMIPSVPNQPGECRKGPPSVFLLMMQAPPPPESKIELAGRRLQIQPQQQMQFISHWPPTLPGWGCGAHEPETEEKAE